MSPMFYALAGVMFVVVVGMALFEFRVRKMEAETRKFRIDATKAKKAILREYELDMERIEKEHSLKSAPELRSYQQARNEEILKRWKQTPKTNDLQQPDCSGAHHEKQRRDCSTCIIRFLNKCRYNEDNSCKESNHKFWMPEFF